MQEVCRGGIPDCFDVQASVVIVLQSISTMPLPRVHNIRYALYRPRSGCDINYLSKSGTYRRCNARCSPSCDFAFRQGGVVGGGGEVQEGGPRMRQRISKLQVSVSGDGGEGGGVWRSRRGRLSSLVGLGQSVEVVLDSVLFSCLPQSCQPDAPAVTASGNHFASNSHPQDGYNVHPELIAIGSIINVAVAISDVALELDVLGFHTVIHNCLVEIESSTR
jgi:hypothetical protein